MWLGRRLGNSGDHQKVSYVDRRRLPDRHRGDADHGALIELGLDYTSFNFNDTSMGVYARTGVVIWRTGHLLAGAGRPASASS